VSKPVELLVFIDVICPWCYVGKRRMEKALAMLGVADRVRVGWLPFELNPDMPKEGIERRLYRMRKFGSWERSQQLDAELTEVGAQEGLALRYDLIARTPNTFDAHRLIWRARAFAGRQEPVVEGLFRAYFTQGRDIGDPDALADIASEAGMGREEATAFLAGEEGAAEVAQDQEAVRRAGLTGVPAFIIDGRALVGAQPPETIAATLRNAMGFAPTAQASLHR
jgi:predicted DsbA family dithiol-disulfide isomerase